MAIRAAEPGDTAAICELLAAQAGRDRDRDAVAVRTGIEGPSSAALVATRDSGPAPFGVPEVIGYVSAHVLRPPTDPRSCWVIDDLGVAGDGLWNSVGRVLLAAIAGRAVQQRIELLLVGCDSQRPALAEALERSGLQLDCWYRRLRLDRLRPAPYEAPAIDDPGLPLPHLHGLMELMAQPLNVTAPGAHALVSATPTRTGSTEGTWVAVADPVIGTDGAALGLALDAVEKLCADRDDDELVVVVGPGEEPLDALLEARGYELDVGWWLARPRR